MTDTTRAALVFLGAIAACDPAAPRIEAKPPAAAPAPEPAPAPLPGLTMAESQQARALSPLPALLPDTTNRYADDPRAAALGRRLFFDASYAGGRMSCASCHSGPGMADTMLGVAPVYGGAGARLRNALGLVNASFYRWVNWAGRFSAQWELPLAVAENPTIMNSDRLRIAHVLYDRYRPDYEAIFGAMDPALGSDPARFPLAAKPKASPAAPDGGWELMSDPDRAAVNRIFVDFGKSIAAYLRTLVSRVSRFDAFVAGDASALDEREVRGLSLFLGKGRCTTCHGGPNFTDDAFHALGVRSPVPDDGRADDVGPLLASPFNSAGEFSDDRSTGRLDGLSPSMPWTAGQFRTPSLRNVAVTAPYMHTGLHPSLDEAIAIHDPAGGTPASGPRDPALVPLGLTLEERAALVAFLGSLTSPPLPASRVQP